MGTYCVHVDRFSAGLDELTRREQGDVWTVLRCLDRIGRFSVFKATENPTIARTMDYLATHKLIEVDHACGFPWSKVKLTEAGKKLIAPKEAIGPVVP